MASLGIEEFRQLNTLDEELTGVKDIVADDALTAARLEIKELIPADAYLDFLLPSPQNADRAAAIRRAQSNFAYALIVPNVSGKISSFGLVKQSANATSGVTDSYQDFTQTLAVVDYYRREGMKAIKAYLTPEDVAESVFSERRSQSVPIVIEW